ncbi:NUDIX domain-containing protein [Pseudonocardia ailaonensis]|uniref:NUDIX domain-containing protein n=1 Tax=Pseudonocardia ailaonensis TaxID=367279 RepID=A0ABN2N5J9_9PSEU
MSVAEDNTPRTPVEPKPAATVLLLRDHPSPPEGRSALQVFLQRRVKQMAFAGGMTVFPGGSVDPSDVPDAERWAGPDPQEWAERIGLSTALAGAAITAAVREVFEETGVLLAGPPGGQPGSLTAQAPLWRKRLTDHSISMTEVLATSGYVLRSDLLRTWARWVTPPIEKRRYDTVFLVAAMPAGQEADAQTTEAVEAEWWFPEQALEAHAESRMALMPPTLVSLRELAGFATAAEALASCAGRDMTAIHPTPRVTEDGIPELVLPDGSVHRLPTELLA